MAIQKQAPKLRFLCALTCVLLALPSLAQQRLALPLEQYSGQDVVAREAIVKFKPGFVSPSAELRQAIDLDDSRLVGNGSLRILHSRSHSAATLVRELSARGEIEYAEPNYIIHAAAVPNDPSFNDQWALRNTGQAIGGIPGVAGADVSATRAWDYTTGSRANVVAVVDSGFNYNHEDLAANVWTAPTSFNVTIGGTTMTCPAGAHGFNAVNNTFDPVDDLGHGTSVAGTIGAVGNNGIGVAGVNWTASIMACKFLDSTGNGTLEGAINAIEFAIQARQALGAAANVRVLSNSWVATAYVQSLADEVTRTNNNNMLFVAAAGNSSANNDTSAFYPANFTIPNVIAVAATDNTDALASFSNYGATTVHLGAPGVNVLTTTVGGYNFESGTSFSTPMVSGAAALILSSNGSLTNTQLKAAILSTVDPIPALAGRTITGGRLNVFRAVASVGQIRPTSYQTIRGSYQSGALSDLFVSDDSYIVWKPGAVLSSAEAPVNVEVTSASPLSTPAALSFRVESRSSVTNIGQTISLFNYTTNAWEQVDFRAATTADGVTTVTVNSNASRFVRPADGAIKARVAFKPTGPVLSYPWSIRLDQTTWSVSP